MIRMKEPFAEIFDDLGAWQVVAPGQAEGRLSGIEGEEGRVGVRLDYDFHGGGGFVVMRREVSLLLPEAFAMRFWLRGAGPENHFEFKILDPSGANAWRHLRQCCALPGEWTEWRICERDLPFAWGPAGGGEPSLVGAIELVIAAGPGGAGHVSFADFSLVDETVHVAHGVSASSAQVKHSAAAVFNSSRPAGWQAETGDLAPFWAVDFGRVVRFGGLVIEWPDALLPRGFVAEISKDGEAWEEVFRASHALGKRCHIAAPRADARHVRLRFDSAEVAGLAGLRLRSDAFSSTPNEFIHAVAADFPRGWFARYWQREQSYWTPIGSPQGGRRALINEEGLVEVDEAGFSLEPFLLDGEQLVTWADAEVSLGLGAGGRPFPSVSWQAGGLTLAIRPWVEGSGEDLVLRTSYQIENKGAAVARLAVAVRPFQVVPPWQAFRNLGGRSPIQQIVSDAGGFAVDGRRVVSNKPAAAHGAAAYEEGGVVGFLAQGEVPPRTEVNDACGLASAALVWNVAAGEVFEVTLAVAYFPGGEVAAGDGLAAAAAGWAEVLAPVEWRVPAVAKSAIDCFRTAASHILINRDGPAIQPGPRRYTRSWVRDCVIMGAAMAKAGSPQVLREFVDWYAEFQRADGFVPCVVDRDGIDWLVEHDSHGQWIWGICEVFRAGGDREFLQGMWPSARLAAEYLLELRSQRLTPEYAEPALSARFGLLPESASHEGYLAHPVHSYWDDFWGVRGMEAAAELAAALGLVDEAARWRAEAAAFLGDVRRSLDQVIDERGLDYIPGSVEWADFDPTATANAIAQLDFADDLPAGPLHRMLDTYLAGFRAKHRGEVAWVNYTAYEIRIIGAMVRVGRREDANELLEFFLSDRRPHEWNQWPEISWQNTRAPGHLGDVPHTWIAAEFMLAVASMVAGEREAGASLVLAAGLPWEWIAEDDGFGVSGLVTRFGRLDFALRVVGEDRMDFSIGAGIALPAGGVLIDPPLPPGTRIIAAIDGSGRALEIDGGRVRVTELPVRGQIWSGDILLPKDWRHPFA
jgi:hypothetical protein